jgi:hypothetical protein
MTLRVAKMLLVFAVSVFYSLLVLTTPPITTLTISSSATS